MKKTVLLDGEQTTFEIISSQWQETWMELKNKTIKTANGYSSTPFSLFLASSTIFKFSLFFYNSFMFVCRPSGSIAKLKTIRKIIDNIKKIRGSDVPLVFTPFSICISMIESAFLIVLYHCIYLCFFFFFFFFFFFYNKYYF